MVLFECPLGHTHAPLGLIRFWGTLRGVHFSACRNIEKCCMWSGNKLIKWKFIPKNSSRGLQMVQLECPGSYTPWSHSLLWYIEECPFHCMQEKGNAACGQVKKWKFIFEEEVLWIANGPL